MRVEVKTKNAPKPIGPYAQAVKAGEFLFISGQGAVDPKTKTVVAGGIEAQTKQTLENIKEILFAAEQSLERVVKVTIFLQRMEDFAGMNVIYSTYFNVNPPARTTVQANLPIPGALVEIDAVAYCRR
jgi:2-iminobutanoate/2-iminopropanoate deaminase